MGPLGLEADEADFNINLPTMDDRSSCLGTIRSSADPYVARHVNSRLLGCRTSVGRHPSHISRPITRLHTAAWPVRFASASLRALADGSDCGSQVGSQQSATPGHAGPLQAFDLAA